MNREEKLRFAAIKALIGEGMAHQLAPGDWAWFLTMLEQIELEATKWNAWVRIMEQKYPAEDKS